MLLAEDAAARVQQKPVQAIFKSVGVEKTEDKTRGDPGRRMREKMDRNVNEDRPGQKRGQQVISLDS